MSNDGIRVVNTNCAVVLQNKKYRDKNPLIIELWWSIVQFFAGFTARQKACDAKNVHSEDLKTQWAMRCTFQWHIHRTSTRSVPQYTQATVLHNTSYTRKLSSRKNELRHSLYTAKGGEKNNIQFPWLFTKFQYPLQQDIQARQGAVSGMETLMLEFGGFNHPHCRTT